ncbi:aspartyl protease [Thermoplasmatales archaeon SM1-50]|nr:MAG: aspartyl protease [Thermoplasmatales archaeon SM1-50]
MSGTPFIFEYRNYPLIPIKFLTNGRETPLIDALLDSGGDFIVIPYAIAKYLRLKLQKAGVVDTAAGETTLYKSVLSMIIFNENQRYTYENLEVHISDRNDLPVLLGRHPIFEDHEIIFQKHQNKLILQPNQQN